jgi:hypothetical protein
LRFQSVPILTMQLRPLTEPFDLELPIVVDDLALPAELRGRYQPEAKTRRVRIVASGALRTSLVAMSDPDPTRMRDWAAANLRLHIHIPPLDSGVTYIPEIDRQARLMLVGKSVDSVDRNECLLDETVVVKLRRPQ